MAYTYSGTKITGTSTSGKIFKNSGIASAKANQTYFNTSTGHVYTCTEGGAASKAKWKYTRTDIAKKPNLTVTKLGVPERSGYKMKASWTIPAEMKKAKNGARATAIETVWTVGTSDAKYPKKKISNSAGMKYKSSTLNLNSFKVGAKTYTRESFWPLTKRKLNAVSISVNPSNSKGDGKAVTKTFDFKTPRKPTLSAFTFEEDGDVSITIKTNAGNDEYERYDTRYSMEFFSSATQKSTYPHANTTQLTSKTISCDARNYRGMAYGAYYRITVKAWARGFQGNSAKVSKSFYIAYPNKPTISKVVVSSKKADGKVTAYIDTNATKWHPVTGVRLEYLANVTYATKESLPADGWSQVESTDDGQCSALSIPLGDLTPIPGRHTWIRVKSWRTHENALWRYSDPMEVKALSTPEPSAEDEAIKILSASAGSDGSSIVVELGWNRSGQAEATTTELTWADAEDAWKSTKAPEEFTFDWSDGPITRDGITYNDSAKVSIKGLEEGKKYYIRARRFLETEDRRTYTKYSSTVTAVTSETPESVVASCERYIPEGESLPVYWTFSGNGLQQNWQIVSSGGTVIAEGSGSIGATRIEAGRIAALATNDTLAFTVQVSTGSGYVVSDTLSVTIISPPSLTITAATPLTAQPYAFTVTASRACDLRVIITSLGAAGQFPDGIKQQTAGDTIHSDVYTPEWEEVQGEDDLTATITTPSGLDFWDLGKYNLSVVAIDRETGLQSAEQNAVFEIAWAHQAADPSEAVTLTPIDTVDENEMHHQAVQIGLTPPTGSAETDVYDIYRMTGDGAYLIGEGFPLTYTAVDEYAPFGEDMTHHYRIAIRTVDGDVEFTDPEYNLDSAHMRFDWENGTLELPYNLSVGDSYKKDVEIRQHMDGSPDGYWNQNIERTASLSSDVIRLEMQDEIDSARKLARYSGPVFVRTPDGSAYEADVQVSDLSTEGILTAIAIDATEIGLTQEFILPTPFKFEEEDEEPGGN